VEIIISSLVLVVSYLLLDNRLKAKIKASLMLGKYIIVETKDNRLIYGKFSKSPGGFLWKEDTRNNVFVTIEFKEGRYRIEYVGRDVRRFETFGLEFVEERK
jgi:hypothetical protein